MTRPVDYLDDLTDIPDPWPGDLAALAAHHFHPASTVRQCAYILSSTSRRDPYDPYRPLIGYHPAHPGGPWVLTLHYWYPPQPGDLRFAIHTADILGSATSDTLTDLLALASDPDTLATLVALRENDGKAHLAAVRATRARIERTGGLTPRDTVRRTAYRALPPESPAGFTITATDPIPDRLVTLAPSPTTATSGALLMATRPALHTAGYTTVRDTERTRLWVARVPAEHMLAHFALLNIDGFTTD